jgi:hypothetical protein
VRSTGVEEDVLFVRENELVYFIGRISSSSFTDEFPYLAVLVVLCALASPRDAQSFKSRATGTPNAV